MSDRVLIPTKIAIVLREDLAAWQKLNVTAFLASGIAYAVPEAAGEPYLDAAGRRFCQLFDQPVMVFAADRAGLQRVQRQAIERGLRAAPYIEAMFRTGHDAANRAVFLEDDPADPDLVGIAVHGDRKQVDKAVKGLTLHG